MPPKSTTLKVPDMSPSTPTPNSDNTVTDSTRPLKSRCSILSLGGEMVKLNVGPALQEKVFTVHKKLLTRKIPYFNTMFNGEWKESTEQVASFPEDHVEAFDVLMEWVYYGDIGGLHELKDDHSKFQTVALNLYALADKLLLPEIQDSVMDELITHHLKSHRVVGKQAIICYRISLPGSGLRRYVVRSIVWIFLTFKCMENWNITRIHELLQENAELHLDFLTTLREIGPGDYSDPRLAPKSDYHCSKPE